MARAEHLGNRHDHGLGDRNSGDLKRQNLACPNLACPNLRHLILRLGDQNLVCHRDRETDAANSGEHHRDYATDAHHHDHDLGEHHRGCDLDEHHHDYATDERHRGSAEQNLADQYPCGSNSVESSDHHRDVARYRANHCAREMDDQCLDDPCSACQNLGGSHLGALDHRRLDAGGPGGHHLGAGDWSLPQRPKDAGHPFGDRLNAVRQSATRLDGRD